MGAMPIYIPKHLAPETGTKVLRSNGVLGKHALVFFGFVFEEILACSRLSISGEDRRKSGRALNGISLASPFSLQDPARRPRLFRSFPLNDSLNRQRTSVREIK